jgi:predicted Fe-Mo cluster-binding NifX family protein
MKIAIVSDDHQTISAHFGRAQFYEVFTIDADKVTTRKTLVRSNPQVIAALRSNPQIVTVGSGHEPEGEHHHHHDHNAMITPISDCQVLLAGGMGMGAHLSLKEHGIQPIITDIHEIQTAVDSYLAGTLVDHMERLH